MGCQIYVFFSKEDDNGLIYGVHRERFRIKGFLGGALLRMRWREGEGEGKKDAVRYAELSSSETLEVAPPGDSLSVEKR